jgi:hypothetical protein
MVKPISPFVHLEATRARFGTALRASLHAVAGTLPRAPPLAAPCEGVIRAPSAQKTAASSNPRPMAATPDQIRPKATSVPTRWGA